MSIGKGLSAKKRWREKNGVDVWECCSQYSGIILQEHGPVFLGTSECASLRIILTMVAKNFNTVDISNGDIYYYCHRMSVGRVAPGLFSLWVQDVINDPGSFVFLALPSHFPLKVTVWL